MTRATLETRLATREEQLAIAEATYTKLLAKVNQSYTFTSGDGSQGAKKQELSELKKQIDKLVAEIDLINRQLDGGSVVRLFPSRWS